MLLRPVHIFHPGADNSFSDLAALISHGLYPSTRSPKELPIAQLWLVGKRQKPPLGAATVPVLYFTAFVKGKR